MLFSISGLEASRLRLERLWLRFSILRMLVGNRVIVDKSVFLYSKNANVISTGTVDKFTRSVLVAYSVDIESANVNWFLTT